MSANADDTEEQFLDLLAACDDALAAGAAADTSTPGPDLQPRLERDLACVRRLRRVLGQPAAAPALPWTTLGRFQLRHELGRGGCGIVYLAFDPLLNRQVALKVPRAEMAVTPELSERFQREAQAAASLA